MLFNLSTFFFASFLNNATSFKEYQFYAEEEKTLKQEKKELSPYTKPAFLKKALSDSTLMQKHEFAATQIQKIDVQIKEVSQSTYTCFNRSAFFCFFSNSRFLYNLVSNIFPIGPFTQAEVTIIC